MREYVVIGRLFFTGWLEQRVGMGASRGAGPMSLRTLNMKLRNWDFSL